MQLPHEQDSKLVLPIIVKRTWNIKAEKQEQQSLFYNDSFEHQDPWDYYAVITNFQLDTATDRRNADTRSSEDAKQKFWSIQEVFVHHQKRGNSENFIKEEKYSFDLKHFPYLKLNANYAFGLLAMVSHNILRWVSVMTKPDKPHYSKKLRRRFISIPAKLVHHARQVFLKMMDINLQEVLFLRETLGLTSEKIPLQFSTA